MTEAEIGVIRSEAGFFSYIVADTYSFGRRDFKDFDDLDMNPPKLLVCNRRGDDFGVLVLDDGADVEDLRDEPIDDKRSLYYDPQGRLSEITFEGISEGAVVDGRIPLPAEELERVKILLSAYRTDLEQGRPSEDPDHPGYYHFIPIPANSAPQS